MGACYVPCFICVVFGIYCVWYTHVVYGMVYVMSSMSCVWYVLRFYVLRLVYVGFGMCCAWYVLFLLTLFHFIQLFILNV